MSTTKFKNLLEFVKLWPAERRETVIFRFLGHLSEVLAGGETTSCHITEILEQEMNLMLRQMKRGK